MPTFQHDCGQRVWVQFFKAPGRKPQPRFLKDGRPIGDALFKLGFGLKY